MKSEIIESIENAIAKGCRFVSFQYQAKGTGEIATHTVALGVSLLRAYKRDAAILRAKGRTIPRDKAIMRQACAEMLRSVRESLQKGIGENSAYTCKGAYRTIGKGLRVHLETGELHIHGFGIAKRVIQAGTYKSVNSSAKTIAKRALGKGNKRERFRQFALSNVNCVKTQGRTLLLE